MRKDSLFFIGGSVAFRTGLLATLFITLALLSTWADATDISALQTTTCTDNFDAWKGNFGQVDAHSNPTWIENEFAADKYVGIVMCDDTSQVGTIDLRTFAALQPSLMRAQVQVPPFFADQAGLLWIIDQKQGVYNRPDVFGTVFNHLKAGDALFNFYGNFVVIRVSSGGAFFLVESDGSLTPTTKEYVYTLSYEERKAHIQNLYMTEISNGGRYPDESEIQNNLSTLNTQINNAITQGTAAGVPGIDLLSILLDIEERQLATIQDPTIAVIDPTVGEIDVLIEEAEMLTGIARDVWWSLIWRESTGVNVHGVKAGHEGLRPDACSVTAEDIISHGSDGITNVHPSTWSDRDLVNGDPATGRYTYAIGGYQIRPKARMMGMADDALQSIYMAALIYADGLIQVDRALANNPPATVATSTFQMDRIDNDGNAFTVSHAMPAYDNLNVSVDQLIHALNGLQVNVSGNTVTLDRHAIAYMLYHHGAQPVLQELVNNGYETRTLADLEMALANSTTFEFGYYVLPAARFQNTRENTLPWTNPAFVGRRFGPLGYEFLGVRPVEECPFTPPSSAVETVDVMLIIDNSGSMGGNDPGGKRLEAAVAYLNVSLDGDFIGVVDFDTVANWLNNKFYHMRDEKDDLIPLINAMSPGANTNIRDAVLTACNALLGPQAQNNRKAAILLTDGAHNEGSYSSAHQCFVNEGWPIYTFGFGDPDVQLMEEIANDTGGEYKHIDNLNSLTCEFQRVRAKIAGAEPQECSTYPVPPGQTVSFFQTLPSNVAQVTFSASWPAGNEIDMSLLTPSGQTIDENTTDPAITIDVGSTFAIYTIPFPEAGDWRIDLYGANVQGASVDVTFAFIPIGPPGPDPDRVSDGLQVLYTFQEGSGTTITDVSGSGTALNLTVADAGAVSWLPGGGLAVNSNTTIESADIASKIIDSATGSNALTIEAWVKPANLTQSGPARIVTLSGSTSVRNFTLGQQTDHYNARLRTTATNLNGSDLSTSSPPDSLTTDLAHVVYTRDAGGEARLYVNTAEQKHELIGGDLSNWDSSYRLALANEFGGVRPWLGELHLIAVYDKPLSLDEIRQNYEAGPGTDGSPLPLPEAPDIGRVTSDLQVLYGFHAGDGNAVYDVSGVGPLLDLIIEDVDDVTWLSGGGLAVDASTIISSVRAADKIINGSQASNEITIEAWVQPANTTQDGPARIVTLSGSTSARNFTLGQGQIYPATSYDVRLRTAETSDNGLPSLTAPPYALTTNLAHVVYTHNAAGISRLYVNGVEEVNRQVGGDFSNWSAAFQLALANEFGGARPWQGELHLVAVYSRALSAAEVDQNFAAGPGTSGTPVVPPPPVDDGRVKTNLQVLYAFTEEVGAKVYDRSGVGVQANLTIADTAAATWLPGGGLVLNNATIVTSDHPATKIIDGALNSNEVTVEAWVKPANLTQDGPARIVTISANTSNRNVTLGQRTDYFNGRLRTTVTNLNGSDMTVSTGSGTATTSLTHVVYTRDASGTARLYVNGVEEGSNAIGGNLSNWDTGYHLALGNELGSGSRPWLGELQLVAVYDRALSAAEITQNYGAGVP